MVMEAFVSVAAVRADFRSSRLAKTGRRATTVFSSSWLHGRKMRTSIDSLSRPIASLKMPARMCTENPSQEVTAGDAMREWLMAKEKGETPVESEPTASSGNGRFKVLFVDRDNASTSVVAEAMFLDLIRRRGFEKYIAVSSAGYRATEGMKPLDNFCEALHFRRQIDIRDHEATKLKASDIDNHHLIVCTDSKTRDNVLYLKIGSPNANEDAVKRIKRKVRVFSEYCTIDKLKKTQFPSGDYRQGAMRMMLSTMVDASNGLVSRLSSGIEKTKNQERKNGGAPKPQ